MTTLIVAYGRRLLVASLVLAALAGSGMVIRSQFSPYSKDFRADYLVAKAMLRGLDPNTPLPDLATALWPEQSLNDLPHPSPHPPAVAWLALPLTSLAYEQAATVWLLVELACLGLAVAMFLRILGVETRTWRIAAITFLLLGWWPVALELRWAQVSMCLLALFIAAWLQLRRGRDVTAGMLLGTLGVLKLAGWPIVLWLICLRRWRAVSAAVVILAAAHLLTIQVHGWDVVRDYYLKVGPQVSAFYRGWEINYSAWTIGQRLFAPSGEVFQSTPLVASAWLARATTVAVPVLILVMAIRAALRLRRLDTSFALLMAIGVVLNPVAWQHYLVMAAPAFVLLAVRLRQLGWPRLMTTVSLLLFTAVSVPYGLYRMLAVRFAVGSSITGKPIVPALPALLTVTTGIALCALLWLLVRLETRPDFETVAAGLPAEPGMSPGVQPIR